MIFLWRWSNLCPASIYNTYRNRWVYVFRVGPTITNVSAAVVDDMKVED